MPNTTNYNWATPADTDLVKDGAAAIRTLGNSIDTTTKNLNPETTTGDIAYRSATANTNTRLPIGSAGQVLTVAAGVPSWATPSDQTPLTTKGDVFTFSTVDARLGVGANGTVLTADSAEATGLKWATPAAGGGMTLLHTVAMTGASTITQSGISGSYKHLLIVFNNISTASGGNDLNCQLNSDSGSKYRWWDNWYLNGVGGNNQAAAGTSFGLSIRTPSSDDAANTIDGFMWIYDYTRTTGVFGNSAINGTTTSSTLIFNQTQFKYSNSAAISAISIIAPSNFDQGNMYIYGVN